MTVEATTEQATTETAIDVSNLPASAFPEGVDPSTYVAGLTATKGETPGDITSSMTARPDHIPEKFWDAEKGEVAVDSMAKSYAELQQKLVERQEAKQADKTLKIEAEEAPPLLTAIEAFKTHYAESNGTPADDQIAALEKAGLPRELINDYLLGVKAREELDQSKAFGMAIEIAGSAEAFDAASDWASKTLSKEDIDSYNSMVEGGHARQGVEWLMAKYKSAKPSEGSFIETETGAAQGDFYRSKAEMTVAFNDPRYRNDPAYRQDVAEKFARSKSQGLL